MRKFRNLWQNGRKYEGISFMEQAPAVKLGQDLAACFEVLVGEFSSGHICT